MLLQVTLLRERSAAVITLEGTLSRVLQEMSFQMRVCLEAFTAVGTFKREFAVVDQHVALQVAFVRADAPANLTSVWVVLVTLHMLS